MSWTLRERRVYSAMEKETSRDRSSFVVLFISYHFISLMFICPAGAGRLLMTRFFVVVTLAQKKFKSHQNRRFIDFYVMASEDDFS